MSHIFVSYARADNDKVKPVVNELRGAGYPLWMDMDSIPGSSDWEAGIQDGINASSAMLLFWTKNAAASEYIRGEYQWATDKGIPIVSLLFDETKLPISVNTKQGIKITGEDAAGIAAQIQVDSTLKALARPMLFKFRKTLALQDGVVPVPETDLVSVPFMQSGFSKVSIIGHEDTVVTKITHKLQLCLDFMGDEEYFTPRAAHDYLGAPEDAIILYVRPQSPPFFLPLDNPAQWKDAVETTAAAVKCFRGAGYPLLQLFAYAPTMLTFGVGKKLFKFWSVALYQNTRGQYHHVWTIPAE